MKETYTCNFCGKENDSKRAIQEHWDRTHRPHARLRYEKPPIAVYPKPNPNWWDKLMESIWGWLRWGIWTPPWRK